jgi:hypothetical protein
MNDRIFLFVKNLATLSKAWYSKSIHQTLTGSHLSSIRSWHRTSRIVSSKFCISKLVLLKSIIFGIRAYSLGQIYPLLPPQVQSEETVPVLGPELDGAVHLPNADWQPVAQ